MDFAIVKSVTHLPPARDMLSLTAVRLHLGGSDYASYFVIDTPDAASAQPGDWVELQLPGYNDTQPIATRFRLLPAFAMLDMLNQPTSGEQERRDTLMRFLACGQTFPQGSPCEQAIEAALGRWRAALQTWGTYTFPPRLCARVLGPDLVSDELRELLVNDC